MENEKTGKSGLVLVLVPRSVLRQFRDNGNVNFLIIF